MTLIEGIGDEVTHFFIGLILLAIVCAAWWTTSIAEHRHVQTVWLLDRRRHRAHRRLTNHTHSVTIAEGLTVGTSTSESPPIVTAPAMEAKPPEGEASTSSDSRSEEDERNQIVQSMDSDTCVLRQRRLAFYNRVTSDTTEGEETITPPTTSFTNQIMEHNYAEAPSSSDNQRNIRIKLKYINDDLKLVDGKLQEQLGDFKKRHFQGELSSNKLVRLIFNGQVLQQDTKTLEGCGLFDNCVVHCLIHQRRPSPGDENPQDSRGEASTSHRNANPNNNNQGRDWDLGNFLFAIISFTLLSAWYFRYVYAHLYTVTATVGLILMTGVFSIVLFGFYFPDHEHLAQRMEGPQT